MTLAEIAVDTSRDVVQPPDPLVGLVLIVAISLILALACWIADRGDVVEPRPTMGGTVDAGAHVHLVDDAAQAVAGANAARASLDTAGAV